MQARAEGVAAPLAPERASVDAGEEAPAPDATGFVARDVSMKELLNAVSGALRKPIVASAAVQRRRISGTFDLSKPDALLRQLADRLALLTYDDGSARYVYDANETRNAVIRTRQVTLGDVRRFLAGSGLLDRRFGLRGDDAARVFYVSGVPIYVELVEAASRYLDAARTPTGGGWAVRVVPLQHAFVVDRDIDMRGTSVKVPGMVTMLQRLLGEANATAARPLLRDGAPLPTWHAAAGAVPPGADAAARAGNDARAGAQEWRGERGATQLLRQASVPPMPMAEPVSAAPDARANAPAGADLGREGGATGFTVSTDAQGVRVVAHPETNSIVLFGPAERLPEIESLVRRLDVQKRQLQLSLWIIDVKKSSFDRLGVDWSGAARLGGAQVRFNDDGLLASTLDGTSFLARVHALMQTDDATVVSRPILLTQENQPAMFDRSETFYTRLQGERAVSLDSITFGTMINVQSRLSTEADEIEMAVGVEDGSATPNSLAVGSDMSLPVVYRTRLSTVARVPRGKSLLIGGSTLSLTDDRASSIPGLSSIPWLGRLFRSVSKQRHEVARLFLIEPRVLDAGASWSDGQPFETGAVERNARLRDTVHLLKEFM
ncbi:type III secretion protein C [Chitinasiproducens palmae]|uniref:Type III secretion protein C n=2 Tax=Chitinasiproducens palmae TaxID=1770053 RepID=A0A1H2PIZ5_9BURK|nr:type III secretion protein C [Chitinasiproducens palmae]